VRLNEGLGTLVMIGWKPRPFIFIHIPKCAGTSIEHALIPIITGRPSFGELSSEECRQFCLPGEEGLQHAKLADFSGRQTLEQFFKFAIVRNPWDRAVAQIMFLRRRKVDLFPIDADFRKCLRIYCESRQVIRQHDLGACQLDFLQTSAGVLGVDFVGRFENVAEDYKKICVHLGLHPAPKLPHVQKSTRVWHYSAYYDDEMVQMVQQRFAQDIDCFGYRFEHQTGSK